MINLLICDDHAVVRFGLRGFLSMADGLHVLAEAATAQDALNAITRHEPDVLLLDLMLPDMNGIDLACVIHKRFPHVRIVILTSYLEETYMIRALHCGVTSYLSKAINPENLIDALRVSYRGQSIWHTNMLHGFGSQAFPHPAHEIIARLSDREKEVLGWIARGLSNDEIARRLVVSETTVRTHVSNILTKLEIENRTQAAIYALGHHLVSVDDARLFLDQRHVMIVDN